MAGFNSFELAHKAFLVDGSRTKQGSDIPIAGNQTTNYPASGGKRIPEGCLVVKESGDGLYYLADGADGASAGDINTAAVITSAEAPDAGWKSMSLTWNLYLPDGTNVSGTVALGGSDETIAAVVTALNADNGFNAHLVASDAGASDLLVITSRAKGRVRLRVLADLDTAFATDNGSTSSDEASGAEADYRVVTKQCDTVDLDGASFVSVVPSLTAGRFDESEMWGGAAATVPNEAKAVLIGRGSTFE